MENVFKCLFLYISLIKYIITDDDIPNVILARNHYNHTGVKKKKKVQKESSQLLYSSTWSR